MLYFKLRFLVMTFFASVVICINPSFALEDNLQKAVEIAIHGGNFQAERLKIATENMANEHSTSFQPGGDPYRRKVVFARNDYNKRLKTNVLRVRKFDTDKSPFIMKYDPNHPAADLNGYVKLPNIHKEIERADASEAQRSYEANLSIIEMSKAMMQKTIEVIK